MQCISECQTLPLNNQIHSVERPTNADVSVRTLEQLVHAIWAQGGAQDPGYRLGRFYVAALSIDAPYPLLFLLLLWQMPKASLRTSIRMFLSTLVAVGRLFGAQRQQSTCFHLCLFTSDCN